MAPAMNRLFFAASSTALSLKNKHFFEFLDCQPRFDLRRYIRSDIALCVG
jgi:hypothetical protein